MGGRHRRYLFSFPTGYHYGALRGLDFLRAAGVTPDARAAEAIDLVRSKRDEGRLPLENPHEGELVHRVGRRRPRFYGRVSSRWSSSHRG